MLTITGVVATLISVFFAIAAWYVQQKRRSLGVPPPVQETVYVETAPPPAPVPVEQMEPLAASAAEAVVPPSAPAPEPSASLFKRYTPSGAEEPVVSPFRDDEYIWE
jgi:hypothetical protein